MDSINYQALNRDFWSRLDSQELPIGDLLVEPSSGVAYIDHILCVSGLLVGYAKNLNLAWLNSSSKIELMRSYCPKAKDISDSHLTVIQKFKVAFAVCWIYLQINFGKSLITCGYKEIKIGDLIYDAYLRKFSVATISSKTYKLALLIYEAVTEVEKNRRLLVGGQYKGVLVAQQITLSAGILLRVAINLGLEGYLCSGGNRLMIKKYGQMEDIYEHQYKPDLKDLIRIANMKSFPEDFEAVMKAQRSGSLGGDSPFAFSGDKKIYTNRIDFSQHFNLSIEKKNIFVMLHAFTDAPHSQHKGMLFKDYYDWFITTYQFAIDRPEFNWIFKQHPSIQFYPTKDVDFNLLFSSVPPHVSYIGEDRQVNSESLMHCADLIVTCAGSAGYEFPAFCGVPSIIAGDNFYRGLGISYEPNSICEYFSMLSDPQIFTPLSRDKILLAQAFYLYINKYAQVDLTAVLPLSLREQNNPNIDKYYWNDVANIYRLSADKIYVDCKQYIDIIRRADFKRLTGLSVMEVQDA